MNRSDNHKSRIDRFHAQKRRERQFEFTVAVLCIVAAVLLTVWLVIQWGM